MNTKRSEEKNKKRYEEKNNMIAPVYTLTLTPPQNDEYVFCKLKNKNLFPLSMINFAVYLCTFAQFVFYTHVCNKINSLSIRR